MAQQIGKFLTELPEATSLKSDDLMYVVASNTSKKIGINNLKKTVSPIVEGAVNGDIASFTDGSDNPLEKCIVEIVPKQAGTGTPSPSNVRAISGHTSVRVNVTNKNHLQMTLNGLKNRNTGGTWNGNVYTLNNLTFTVNADTNGVVNSITVNGTNADTYTRFTLDMPILISGQTYTLSGAPSGYIGTSATIYLGNSPATIGITNPAISDGVPVTFTPTQTGEPTANINVNAGVTVNNAVFYPQIEIGTEATAYEPYNGTTYTTPLGQTVYGGQLNVLTGELTIDRGFMTITSESQLTTFTYNAENGSFSQVASDGKISNAEVMCISNIMEGISFNNRVASAYVDKDRCYSDETGKIRIRNRSSVTINTKAELFARFEGAEICYFLSTPQTVQLTPQEVNSLLGQNNISADTGSVEVIYARDLNIVINDLLERVAALENE